MEKRAGFLSIEHDPRLPLTPSKGKEGLITGHITSEYSVAAAAVEAYVTSIALCAVIK
jgi:hypothetical protein